MEEGRALAQIKPSILANLPISKNFNNKIVKEIEMKTDEIIGKIKNGLTSIDVECNSIDQLVYELYELSEQQIMTVEAIPELVASAINLNLHTDAQFIDLEEAPN